MNLDTANKANTVNSLIHSIYNGEFTLDGRDLFVDDFNCSRRNLTSLLGGPLRVNDYDCSHNQLYSLSVIGDEILEHFSCSNNELTSLRYGPREVGLSYDCSDNLLRNLEGLATKIGGSFDCGNNLLTSLKYCPKLIAGTFACANNQLTSFENSPREVYSSFVASDNLFTSLYDIHKHISYIGATLWLTGNPIKSHVLGLLKIDGLKKVMLDDDELDNIMNKYLKGSRDILDCQEELIEAGLEEFAQL